MKKISNNTKQFLFDLAFIIVSILCGVHCNTSPTTISSYHSEELIVLKIIDSMSLYDDKFKSISVKDIVHSQNGHITKINMSQFNLPFFPFDFEKLPELQELSSDSDQKYSLIDLAPLPHTINLTIYDGTMDDTTDAGAIVSNISLRINKKPIIATEKNSTDFMWVFKSDEDDILIPSKFGLPIHGSIPQLVGFDIDPDMWTFIDGTRLQNFEEIKSIEFVYSVAGNYKIFMSSDDQVSTHWDSILNTSTMKMEFKESITSLRNIYYAGVRRFPEEFNEFQINIDRSRCKFPLYFGAWIDSQSTILLEKSLFDSVILSKDYRSIGQITKTKSFIRPKSLNFSKVITQKYIQLLNTHITTFSVR